MKKSKLKYILILAIILLTGWILYMLQKEQVYIYDIQSETEKVNVTDYYQTGEFYIHTDKEIPTLQKLIRKHPPHFAFATNIEKANRDIIYVSSLIDNQEELIKKLIDTFPDFSERMKYYSSYINSRGELNESYIGYFDLDGKEYTLKVVTQLTSINNQPNAFIIDLSENYFNFASNYEKYLEEAKKQPQPPL